MNIRSSFAGIALASALLLGGVTAGVADAAPVTVPTNLTPEQCKAAAHVLHELKVAEAHAKADYAKLVKFRDAQAKAGHAKVVQVLDAKLAQLRRANAKAVARVKAIAAKVRAACAPAPAAG